MAESRNYQNQVLDEAQNRKKPISIFLAKGVRVEGLVRLHDAFTILMETKEGQVLVYKRSITSLFPARLYYNPQNNAQKKNSIAANANPKTSKQESPS